MTHEVRELPRDTRLTVPTKAIAEEFVDGGASPVFAIRPEVTVGLQGLRRGCVAEAGDGSAVSLVIGSGQDIYGDLIDALSTAEDNYADPRAFVMSPRTIGVARKVRDSQGHPLLTPDLSQAGADLILGRQVISAPQMQLGTPLLVDPRAVHVGIDLQGYARILLEAFADHDQVGVLVVTKMDIATTLPLGLVAVTGLGPAA